MPPAADDPIYQPLPLPEAAAANGGVEILRAGLIDEELYVTAGHAFKDPAQWGEVLADIARRLALFYSAEGEYEEAEVLAAIESAFAAELGAPVVKETPTPARKTTAKKPRKAPPRGKPAPKRAPKPAKPSPKRSSKPAKAVKRSKR